MKIMVCIKQVPGTSNVKVDPVTGVLIRDGALSKMNPYDLFALETALSLREQTGGELMVITMGPPAAKAVLNEAVYMGADGGVLVTDRRFGGADVLATARTLASAIAAAGDFDIILCGKQTTDGDTAQVGAEIAEYMGLPHFANVGSIEITGDGRAKVVSELGATRQTALVKLPAVFCADADINTPRLPSYKRKCQTAGDESLIKILTLDDFADNDPNHYGLAGSPTQVERIFPPEKNTDRQFVEGADATNKVYELLKTKKFI